MGERRTAALRQMGAPTHAQVTRQLHSESRGRSASMTLGMYVRSNRPANMAAHVWSIKNGWSIHDDQSTQNGWSIQDGRLIQSGMQSAWLLRRGPGPTATSGAIGIYGVVVPMDAAVPIDIVAPPCLRWEPDKMEIIQRLHSHIETPETDTEGHITSHKILETSHTTGHMIGHKTSFQTGQPAII